LETLLIIMNEIQIHKKSTSLLTNTDFSNLNFGTTFSDHMFTADYEEGKWQNQQIIALSSINLHPAAAVLHYGQSIFEGLKAYRHVDGNIALFRLDRNADRLNKSAERLCMPQVPPDMFIKAISTLVELDKNWIPSAPDHALYIRPILIATDASLAVQPSGSYKFIVVTSPVGPYFSKPLNVKIETDFTRSAEGGIGYAKAAGNYAGAMYPTLQAKSEGFDQLIWTDAATHNPR